MAVEIAISMLLSKNAKIPSMPSLAALRKRFVHLVKDQHAIVDIFQKFYENGPCIGTISFRVTMFEVRGNFLGISKPLIKYSMKIFYVNLKLLVYQEIFSHYFRFFLVTYSKETRTHNHLVDKRTLNYLAKLA